MRHVQVGLVINNVPLERLPAEPRAHDFKFLYSQRSLLIFGIGVYVEVIIVNVILVPDTPHRRVREAGCFVGVVAIKYTKCYNMMLLYYIKRAYLVTVPRPEGYEYVFDSEYFHPSIVQVFSGNDPKSTKKDMSNRLP
jgi:hypothetical protein